MFTISVDRYGFGDDSTGGRVTLSDDPFECFTVEDEHPGDEMRLPSGYLRLVASDKPPAVLQQEALANRLRDPVLQHIRENPGGSKRQLRLAVKGDNMVVERALSILMREGLVRVEDPAGPGKPCRISSSTPTDEFDVEPLVSGSVKPPDLSDVLPPSSATDDKVIHAPR